MDRDLVLLGQWRAGDKAAGEELFGRHVDDVLRFFANKVRGQAEDLTQQTFAECVASQARFRGESSFRTYLFAIAWNQLRHHLRRGHQNEPIDFDVSSLGEIEASLPSVGSNLDRRRRAQRIQQALAQLPLAQQTLLELHYWQGLDAASLSEVFGVPSGAIRVRLLRARNGLRAQLERLSAAGDSAPEEPDDPLSISLKELAATDKADSASHSSVP